MLYRMFNHLCQQYKVYVYLRHGLWVTLHKMFQYLCISLHVLWLTSKESIPSPESSSSSAGLEACFGVISWYTSLGLRLRSSRSNGSCANRKGDISFITDWNTNRIKLKLSMMRIKLKIHDNLFQVLSGVSTFYIFNIF